MTKERIEILLGILIVIAVVGGVYYLAPHRPLVTAPVPRGITMPPPPLTPELKQKVEASTGFDFVVSYTERGFEPASAKISVGDTVRFVNNKPGAELWVAAHAARGTVYPGTEDSCGQSAFDECSPIKTGEFWEFTFEYAGTWAYHNNTKPTDVGSIVVE